METKTQKQCKDYIRPLFRLCKNKEVGKEGPKGRREGKREGGRKMIALCYTRQGNS